MNKPDLFRKATKDIFKLMELINIDKEFSTISIKELKLIYKNSYISFRRNSLCNDDEKHREFIVSYCKFIGQEVYYFTMFIFNFDCGCKYYHYGNFNAFLNNIELYNYDKPIHHLQFRYKFNLNKLNNYQQFNDYKKLDDYDKLNNLK